jgi:hypothetical protein
MLRRAAAPAALLLSLLASPGPASSTTIRVPQDYWTIQAAVNATGPGDTVLVHPREYPELVVIQAPGVTILGSTGDPADIRVRTIRLDRAEEARIEAITLTGGPPLVVQNATGAMLINVGFEGSSIPLFGSSAGGSIVFEGCDFGAVRLEVYSDPFDCTVRDSRFGPRTHLGNGGAIWVRSGTRLVAERCVFHELQVDGNGGAIYCENGSTAIVDRCTFVRNWASGAGGAIAAADATVDVSNSILYGSVQGEGIACVGSEAGVTVTHCILFGNAHGDAVCGVDGGNLVLDPRLCNPLDPDALGLCANSPALAGSPDNPWGEDIGALGQECLCTVSLEPSSWGRLKGRYR